MRSIAALLAALALPAFAQDVAVSVSHQGYLVDANDAAVERAALPMTFTLHTQPSAATAGDQQVWSSGACSVAVSAGFYAVVLGGTCGSGLTSAHLPPDAPRYLQAVVDGSAFDPRLRVVPAPASSVAAFAKRAGSADDATRLAGQALADLDVRYARLGAAGTQAGGLDLAGTIKAAGFTGGGAGLTSLAAANLTGTVPDAALPASLARTNADQTFTGAITATRFNGSGAGLANVPWTALAGVPADLADGDQTGLAAAATATNGGLTGQGTAGAPLALATDSASLPKVSGGALSATGNNVVAAGSVQIGNSTAACTTSIAGTLRWTGAALQVCTGSVWRIVTMALGEQGTPALSCKAIRDAAPGATSAAYWIDPDGTGSGTAFQVYCDMALEDGGWIDVVESFHLPGVDRAALLARLFVTNGVSASVIQTGNGLETSTQKKGFWITNYWNASYSPYNHTEGFHFKPAFSYSQVRTTYRMQGTQNDASRCSNSNWIPLNGPGYNGGCACYLSPCPSGFTCIQGSPTDGRDAPILVSYTNDSITSSNTLLTWSGSYTSATSESCARDPEIPTSTPSTFFTRLLVR